MNQHADTLADYPYEAHVVELETNQLPTHKKTVAKFEKITEY